MEIGDRRVESEDIKTVGFSRKTDSLPRLTCAVGKSVRQTEDIVSTDMIIFTEHLQPLQRERAMTIFIFGIVRLSGLQKVGYFLLGFLMVYPEILDSLVVFHSDPPSLELNISQLA